jgi:hypothetical protein
MRRVPIALVAVGLFSIATLLSSCSSSDGGSCTTPLLYVDPTHAQAGDRVTISSDELNRCPDGDLISPGTTDVALSFASWKQVGDSAGSLRPPAEIPDWTTAHVNDATHRFEAAATIPASLGSGRFMVVVAESPAIRSGPVSVS